MPGVCVQPCVPDSKPPFCSTLTALAAAVKRTLSTQPASSPPAIEISLAYCHTTVWAPAGILTTELIQAESPLKRDCSVPSSDTLKISYDASDETFQSNDSTPGPLNTLDSVLTCESPMRADCADEPPTLKISAWATNGALPALENTC